MASCTLSRRGLVAGLAAAPLVAAPAFAAPAASDHEARFLALIPWFMRVVPPAERARGHATRLHAAGIEAVGVRNDGKPLWSAKLQAIWQENGYMAAADRANDLDGPIVAAFEPFLDLPMTTLPALAWKARLSLYLFDEAEDVLDELAALAGRMPEA